MSLDRYLRALDTAFRKHDGESMARYLSANAGDIPYAKDFVPYMEQVYTEYDVRSTPCLIPQQCCTGSRVPSFGQLRKQEAIYNLQKSSQQLRCTEVL